MSDEPTATMMRRGVTIRPGLGQGGQLLVDDTRDSDSTEETFQEEEEEEGGGLDCLDKTNVLKENEKRKTTVATPPSKSGFDESSNLSSTLAKHKSNASEKELENEDLAPVHDLSKPQKGRDSSKTDRVMETSNSASEKELDNDDQPPVHDLSRTLRRGHSSQEDRTMETLKKAVVNVTLSQETVNMNGSSEVKSSSDDDDAVKSDDDTVHETPFGLDSFGVKSRRLDSGSTLVDVSILRNMGIMPHNNNWKEAGGIDVGLDTPGMQGLGAPGLNTLRTDAGNGIMTSSSYPDQRIADTGACSTRPVLFDEEDNPTEAFIPETDYDDVVDISVNLVTSAPPPFRSSRGNRGAFRMLRSAGPTDNRFLCVHQASWRVQMDYRDPRRGGVGLYKETYTLLDNPLRTYYCFTNVQTRLALAVDWQPTPHVVLMAPPSSPVSGPDPRAFVRKNSGRRNRFYLQTSQKQEMYITFNNKGEVTVSAEGSTFVVHSGDPL